MSILPWLKRVIDRLSERDKILECSTPSIVLAADRRLCEITMAMTKRIAALSVEFCVLGIGKSGGMQSMRSIERHLHPKKNSLVVPYFRKKIVSLVQANTMQRHQRIHTFVNISRQALGRYRTILQSSDLSIEISMIEFRTQ